MVLDTDKVGNIYVFLKDIIKISEVYDERLISTIYTLLIKDIFDELEPSSCGCKVLKSPYLLGHVTVNPNKIYNQINYDENTIYSSKINGVKKAENILSETMDLNPNDKYIYSEFDNKNKTIKFIITPTFKSFRDRDLYVIFKLFQMYSYDVHYDKTYFCYDVFKDLIKGLFEDFQTTVRLEYDDAKIYCKFGNDMEEKIAKNTLINNFDFKEDKTLYSTDNGFYIEPIDNINYEMYMEDEK